MKLITNIENSISWDGEDKNFRDIIRPFNSFNLLLRDLGWEPSEWFNYWLENRGEDLAKSYLAEGTKLDWVWGLGLPFLSDIKRFLLKKNKRSLFGISALPGCGKTTFGKWLEASAEELDISLKVLSMDDFYLPGTELEIAMSSNPWKVPRALPGSHSIELLETAIDQWLNTGLLNAPQFDKSLRNGLGDRSGWIRTNPDVLVLEGWFLGCRPSSSYLKENKDKLTPSLTEEEKEYRKKVQQLLINYLSTWEKLDRIWHIKAIDFASTSQWKVEQEQRMLSNRGAALEGQPLISFVRMIQASIPQQSLMHIDCDVVIEINKHRDIINILSNNRKNINSF